MRLRTLAAALLVPAACAGDPARGVWARGEAVAQLVAEQARVAEPGTTLRLADLAPFRWERLYVLPGGGAATPLADSLGPDWLALAGGAPTGREGAPRLVFLVGGAVVAAGALPTDAAELAPELLARSWPADSAVVRVERRAGAVPRLVPAILP